MPAPQVDKKSRKIVKAFRTAIFGIVIVLIVIGLSAVITAIAQPTSQPIRSEKIDALANSADQCVVCHRSTTPGIVEQFGISTMAGAGIMCKDCHEVAKDYAGGVAHEGTWVLPSPTPSMCGKCHSTERDQYYQSRHSAPAYAAMRGTQDFSYAQTEIYKNIPEGSYAPDKEWNILYGLEGEDVTKFACHTCHDIGQPNPDDSIGECWKCHLRHEFSLVQARKPETCNACHIGPDHPQWEIYIESPHGIAYNALGDGWNWTADPGTLTVNDFPAPTCSICHMSGFGAEGSTHDVGERLSWYSFSSISEKRPNWEENRVRMQKVCAECHNKEWIDDFYLGADKVVDSVNAWVKESNDIVKPLKDQGLITPAPFDEPIDFGQFELWHHWGRTAKFGAWMQGPDYTQWHGAYEILRELTDLKTIANEKLNGSNPGASNVPITKGE